jgi:hypothetical protein
MKTAAAGRALPSWIRLWMSPTPTCRSSPSDSGRLCWPRCHRLPKGNLETPSRQKGRGGEGAGADRLSVEFRIPSLGDVAESAAARGRLRRRAAECGQGNARRGVNRLGRRVARHGAAAQRQPRTLPARAVPAGSGSWPLRQQRMHTAAAGAPVHPAGGMTEEVR